MIFVRFGYLHFLRYFAKLIAWISILIILICLIAIGIYCFVLSEEYRDESPAKMKLKYVAIGLWILAGLYVIALLCLWKSLNISLAILEAASEYVGTNKKIILVPIVFFIFNFLIFIMWILAIVACFSVGDIDNGPDGT